MCIVLRRLSTPCRYRDIEVTFGKHASALSEIFWEVSMVFYKKLGKLVTSFRADLMKERAEVYAECIFMRSDALPKCVGFMDGTKVRIARPGGRSIVQRSCYSGHKRIHCLVFQTITTPDGLIFHLYGPVEGRRPDAYLYRESGVDLLLQQHLHIDGEQFYLYADKAYVVRPWMQTAFPGPTLTAEQAEFNRSMNTVRTAVEWSYGEVKKNFSTQDFHRKLIISKAPVGVLYVLCVLLHNFKTCLKHGGQGPHYFKCDPPAFDRYLSF